MMRFRVRDRVRVRTRCGDTFGTGNSLAASMLMTNLRDKLPLPLRPGFGPGVGNMDDSLHLDQNVE